MLDFMSRGSDSSKQTNIQTTMQLSMRKSSMREEKGRRRGNKAVWPYKHSCLIQTKKRKHPKQVIMQMT